MINIVSKDLLLQHLWDKKPGIYSFVNPYSAQFLTDTESILFGVDSWILARTLQVKQCSFDNSSMAPQFFQEVQNSNGSLLVIGSDSHKVKLFGDTIERIYNLNGNYIDGYRDFKEYRRIVSELNPNFILIGTGTPKQEELGVNLFDGDRFIITCGGFITQASGEFNYFPKWATRLRLHWLYRIVKERHVLKRVLVYYPRFLLRFKTYRFKKV